MFNSSNRAREIVQEKSMPSKRESISIVACVEEDSVRLALSHCVLKRRSARWLPAGKIVLFCGMTTLLRGMRFCLW